MWAEASCAQTNAITARNRNLCVLFMESLRGKILLLHSGLKEAIVCVIGIFHLKTVSQIRQEAFECRIFIGRDLQCGKDASEIRTVISIVEKRDVPAAAKRVEELKKRA